MIALQPKSANAYASRAWVELRRDMLAPAGADFAAALKIDPKRAMTLYGEGLVRKRQGDKAGAEQDFAAARVIDAKIDKKVADLGYK